MLRIKLEELKKYILQNMGNVFVSGYANAYKDKQNGHIYARYDGKFAHVFPVDRDGNYFYLRNEKAMTFQDDYRFQTECGKTGTMTQQNIYCIAVVKDADEIALVEVLSQNIQQWSNMYVKLIDCVYNSTDVVLQELSQIKKEDKAAALTRANEYTIVSVRFALKVEMRFKQKNCQPKICDC